MGSDCFWQILAVPSPPPILEDKTCKSCPCKAWQYGSKQNIARALQVLSSAQYEATSCITSGEMTIQCSHVDGIVAYWFWVPFWFLCLDWICCCCHFFFFLYSFPFSLLVFEFQQHDHHNSGGKHESWEALSKSPKTLSEMEKDRTSLPCIAI